MANIPEREEEPGFVWAPGTVALGDLRRGSDQIILHPSPSSDPNDPLNWSKWRKILNFSLVSFYVLWTFVQLDIGFTAWGPIISELGFSVNLLNDAAAVNYAGLGVGCIFFIPFVHKYGRRPLYLFSSALQFASCIWQAKVMTAGDIIGSNLISGLGGAISETVVQITIADLFFVHQHATMNGWYLLFTSIGAFLGPVASGYVVDSQGWRWTWWWCVIFLGINLVAISLFFEESKYTPVVLGHGSSSSFQAASEVGSVSVDKMISTTGHRPKDSKDAESAAIVENTRTEIDPEIKLKTYRQRMALITKTDGSFVQHFYQPVVVLFSFPAVAYTALTYGSILAWFAIMTSVQATYLILPPYNFTAIGIGLMNLPPFIGTFLGFFFGGWFNDKTILWFSNRNNGIYEPEMRLWCALPSAVTVPAGILMFGFGLAYKVHWILLAVGYGVFGFGFMVATDIALSYCTDCYQDIIGDALVGVVFSRNAFSVIVLFAITPWIAGMGVQNLHILVACLACAILLIPIPLLMWGKRARIATAKRYRIMAMRQPTHRTFGRENSYGR